MKRLKNIFAATLYYITVCLLFMLEVPIVITTTVFLAITSLLSTIQQKLTKLNKWINANYHPKRNK